MVDDLVYRLRKRAEIRRQIPDRKSVQEGSPDRIADLLEEAADRIENRKWIGLTDDETDILITLHAPPIHPDFNDDDDFIELVEAIEAKLKEKNK